MAATINADNGVSSGSAGLKSSADSTGVLALQTNGTTAVSISASQVVTLTNALPVASGGSGVTTSTGTGAVVLGTSPTISSPTFSGTPTGVGVLTSSTAVTLTTQTSVDFTSIPSWVKRITVMFSGVSQSTTDDITLLLGTGATPTYASSGYNGLSISQAGGSTTNLSTSFKITCIGGPTAALIYGITTLTLITGNTWVCNSSNGNGTATGVNQASYCYGSNALGDTLTAIRIALTGAGTFDAGSINILYE